MGKIDVKVNLYSIGAGKVNAGRVERSLATPGSFTVVVGRAGQPA